MALKINQIKLLSFSVGGGGGVRCGEEQRRAAQIINNRWTLFFRIHFSFYTVREREGVSRRRRGVKIKRSAIEFLIFHEEGRERGACGLQAVLMGLRRVSSHPHNVVRLSATTSANAREEPFNIIIKIMTKMTLRRQGNKSNKKNSNISE